MTQISADTLTPQTLARWLFAQNCEFFWSAADSATLPPIAAPEFCFLGRSNVGKSSLLNALCGQNALARVSHTPGRTQELNFFALGGKADPIATLVDMPGYGYAAVAKAKSASWRGLIEDYLRGRTSLLRALVLIDSRRGLGKQDEPILALLDRCAVSYQIILTKADALNAPELVVRITETQTLLKKHPAAHPDALPVSSHAADGIDAVRAALTTLMLERGVLTLPTQNA